MIGLRKHVFLFTALVLLKSAYNKDVTVIDAIFRLWHETGFTGQVNQVMFFLRYIMEIRDLPLEQLQKKIEECKINGGDIMPSLAQRLRDEGETLGENKSKKEIAKRMLLDKFPIEIIIKLTGLAQQDILALQS